MSDKKYKCPICETNKSRIVKYEKKYFDEGQNKCILHCDKTEKNSWYKINDIEKKWNEEKVKFFWWCIQEEINYIFEHNHDKDNTKIDSINYKQIVFPKHEKNFTYDPVSHNLCDMATNFYGFVSYEEIVHEQKVGRNDLNSIIENLYITFNTCVFLDKINFKRYSLKKGIYFDDCTFHDNVVLGKKNEMRLSFISCNFMCTNLNFSYATFHRKIEIFDCKEINKINFKESTFNGKVKIQFCAIKNDSDFYNTKFNELADFYQTEFNKVIFERTDFNNIAVFSESTFLDDVDFKYTKFIKKSIFRDTVIKGTLNLRDTIFDDEANFLDISFDKKIKKDIFVKNRETARVIKNFFDTSNNIIEANRFYKLEMEKREEELAGKINRQGEKIYDLKKEKNDKNIMEQIIFLLHKYSSNHSQNWLLAFFYIYILGIVGALITFIFKPNEFGTIVNFNYDIYIGILLFSFVNYYFYLVFSKKINFYMILSPFFLLIYIFITKDFFLTQVASIINPFSLTQGNITLGELIFKVIITYFIYQFVVSVRQNTRRK